MQRSGYQAAQAWTSRAALVVMAALLLGQAAPGGHTVTWAGVASTGVVWAADAPLRSVNWLTVLSNDLAITIDPTAFQPPGESGPYIKALVSGSRAELLEGYALISSVQYADLDGDGAEEAIIPVSSGGTAGLLGFLLFREGTPAPRLALAETGYKLSFVIEGQRLAIYRPNYVGFEPNCCPSSTTRTLTRLDGDRLVVITTETEPNDVQEVTVWAFYAALQDGRFEEAYDFSTPAFKAANPFDRWKAGYATTQSIEVETSPGATPDEVRILLTATDSTPGGGSVTRRFRGSWTLVWSAEQKRWLLDRARIEAV